MARTPKSPSPQARVALYAGSFDPVTNGHLDVLRQACGLCDRMVIAIGVHPGKTPLFTVEERARMLEAACAPFTKQFGTVIEVMPFEDLVIQAARRAGATMMIRGLRDGTDLDYEMQMAGMNGRMAPDIETVFLPASPEVRHVTGTLVRQIALMGGPISDFVSPSVAKRLKAKAAQRKKG